MRRMKFEPEVESFLKQKSSSTSALYASGYSKFVVFYKEKYCINNVFSHFIDRINHEKGKPLAQQKIIALIELEDFINYLTEKKYSKNSIRIYVSAIKNLLNYYQIMVSLQDIPNFPFPQPKEINKTHDWHIEEIRQFVETSTDYREKAIIMCMFQSGLSLNDICRLNYGDIKTEFEQGIMPICLQLRNKTTGLEFRTFFGRDALKYLRAYLTTREDLNNTAPLFTKYRLRGGKERLTPWSIQQNFKQTTKKLNFIYHKGGYNPGRPQSLRFAFYSRLDYKIDENLRKFWMGQSLGKVAKLYLSMPIEELRKLYMSAEEFLKIEKSSLDVLEKLKSPSELDEIKLLTSKVDTLRHDVSQLNRTINEFLKSFQENI